MADVTELFSQVSKVLGPLKVDTRTVANLVPQAPRRRAAVVVHDGYAVLDTYHAVRPKLFVGSLVVAAGATGMAWWRRRQGTEAITSWGLLAGLAGLVAYVTRPGAGTGNPAAAQGPTTQDRVYGWLDARAAKLDRTEPGWEERTMRKVLG